MSRSLAAGAVVLALAAPAYAANPAPSGDLTIAWAAAPTSADPHYHAHGPNNALAREVFGGLTRTDAKGVVRPGLARSWEVRDDRTWVFHLADAKFHNGTPFTANDVIYTLCRLQKAVGPTQSFLEVPKTTESVTAEDAHTIVLRTHAPDPSLPGFLTDMNIVSAHSAGASAAIAFSPADQCGVPLPISTDFDSLKMANGTGPYRLTRYVSGDLFVLEANPDYYGEKPHWAKVTVKAVPNTGSRTAGLLAGDFDLIENPAAQDLPTIKAKGGLAWTSTVADRLIFFQPDSGRATSPGVEADGKNPLADVRVRRALSMAIDRKALADRVMDGLAVPTEQLVGDGLPGYLPQPPHIPYDPAGARKLLAEAGYPNGFGLTISSTNDRYINDAKVVQAVAQFLTRVGIHAKVDAMPQSVYFGRRAKRDFSFSIGGWGAGPTAGMLTLRTWLAAPDSTRGLGGSNYGFYLNPAFDAALLPALTDLNDVSREKHLEDAHTIALNDAALVPLYWETSVWAYKDLYTFTGRTDQATDIDGLSLRK